MACYLKYKTKTKNFLRKKALTLAHQDIGEEIP